jgi:hypothetical protein
MMSRSKKFIEECQNFDRSRNLQQWKIDMLQPEIDKFNLDEQILVSHSKALSLICTWIVSMIDSYKSLTKTEELVTKYHEMSNVYNEKGKLDTSLDEQIDKAQKVLEKSEAVLSK